MYTKPTSQGKFEGHEVTRQGEGRASVPESAFDVGLVRAMASRWDEGTAREWGGGRRAPGTRDPPPEDGGGLVPPEAVAAANLALAPVLQELESGDSLAATRAHAMAESNYEEAAAVAAAAAVCSPASPEADSSPSKESIEADSGVAPAGPRHGNEAGSFHSMSSGGEVEHEMEVLEHEMEVLSRLASIVDSGTRQRWTVCTSTTYTPPGTLVPAEDMQQYQDSLVGTLEDMQQMFEAPTSPPDEAQPLESATRLTPAEADLGSSVDTSGWNGSGSWTLEEKQAVAEPTSPPDESQPVESATCLAPAGPAARGIGLDETSPAPPSFGHFPLMSVHPSIASASRGPYILELVGAHVPDFAWHCGFCRADWFGWRCDRCSTTVPLAWTGRKHWGGCGQSCGCCRAENPEDWGSGCECCRTLLFLARVSRGLRGEVRQYSGR